MDSNTALIIANDSIAVLLKILLPILIAGLVTGIVISLFQALTQIQEPTLSFIPKIIVVFFVIFLTLNYIGEVMFDYSEMIASSIIHLK